MKHLVQGNEAIFLGALRAGATFFAGYPITPSTDDTGRRAGRTEP